MSVRMSIVPKRDYIALLLGDIAVFMASLWLTLALRNLALPSASVLQEHVVPFSILFAVWVFVFFLAGLYGRYTRIMRAKLPGTILYAQTVNVVLAALFFFFIPYFGIAPKTILAIYLVVSSGLFFLWRVFLFERISSRRRLGAILIGSGFEVREVSEEVARDTRLPFVFNAVLDTEEMDMHEIVQRLCRVAEEQDIAVIVADSTDPIMSAALPIIYDIAFRKHQFVFVEFSTLYEELFERVPMSMIQYDWVLEHLSRPALYDIAKRGVDAVLGVVGSVFVFVFVYPVVALAIKLDDGGPVLFSQERIGRHHRPFRMYKFRSMSGVDVDDEVLKSKQQVTRVGKFLRKFHIDESPQFWNLVRGDLSFVGPRPELPALVAHYAARIPYYNARHLVAPGLTGWARIRHLHDPHHESDVMETKHKLSYDLYYLKHRSLILDIHIILQTIKVVLRARGGGVIWAQNVV